MEYTNQVCYVITHPRNRLILGYVYVYKTKNGRFRWDTDDSGNMLSFQWWPGDTLQWFPDDKLLSALYDERR